MSLYPHEINDTDNFWFDFTTSAGKHYYYVNPKEGKKELLFDNKEMAMLLSGLTHEVVNPVRLDLSELKFAKDQKSFVFSYRSKKYDYNRITRKLKEVEEKKVDDRDDEPIYTWMNFSPDKKYILYAKDHNLYVKGNKSIGSRYYRSAIDYGRSP